MIESDRNVGCGVRQLPLESSCGLTNYLSLDDTLYLSEPVFPVEEKGELLIRLLGSPNAEMVIFHLMLARCFLAFVRSS